LELWLEQTIVNSPKGNHNSKIAGEERVSEGE
jgi:hypothetical protein